LNAAHATPQPICEVKRNQCGRPRLLDVDRIRKDFPILQTGIIYMDSAASSLTPEPVVQKMVEYYHSYRANVDRGIHRLSQKASDEYESAHQRVAEFLNAQNESEVIFTRNTTEGINLVASGLDWEKGDKVVITLIEHHSDYIVWLRAKKRFGLDVEVVRPNEEGLFALEPFESTIDDRTRLVAVTGASNVLGVKTPVKEIAKVAHDHGARILIDGAQMVPHVKTDVRDLNCDYLAFSGHKMLGPTGIGALYLKEECIEETEPLNIGGGSIEDVGVDYYRLRDSPNRFEGGTPPIAEAIGLGAAVDYLRSVGMDNIADHERALTEKLYKGLVGIPGMTVYGPREATKRVGICAFNLGKIHAHDLALMLDVTSNIMIRSGHHCALPLAKELISTPQGTARASLYLYNTAEEVDRLLNTLGEVSRSIT